MLSACVQTDAIRLDETSRYAPSQNVAVLVEPPSQPHEVISMLESRGAVRQTLPALLESMRERARQLGADAIIPTEELSEQQLQGLIYNAFLGGYQTIGGGRVPILRGYAIIYDVNREARARSYRAPGITGGVALNTLPLALGGFGAEGWAGIGRFRGVAEMYTADIPQAFTRDGFTDGRIERALRLTGDYFFLKDMSGPYFGTGIEYSSFSAGHESTTARGEWDTLFATAGVGYLFRITPNVHFDARLAVNARIVGEENVNVGGFRMVPDDVTPAAFIGIGINF